MIESDFEGVRMAVMVGAASVAAARKLVEGYLPDLDFTVKPVIRKA